MLRTLLISGLLIQFMALSATPAPDFTITDSDGKVRHLYDDFVNQGKVVVMEIFFTTCPPCATHAPYWQGLYESVSTQFPGQVEFFLLSDKSADDNVDIAQYKLNKGLTMVAAGSDGGSLDAVQPYKSGQFGPYYGTPTFLVIAPETGEVIFDIRGGNPAATMDSIELKIAEFLLEDCFVATPQGDTLLNYNMRVQTPGGGMHVDFPVNNGLYSLENGVGLPNLPFYEAIPTKQGGDPLNGVSTFDLVQINRQILGIVPFQHPWQFVAADANNSNTITTFDIVELRKLILGIYDSLPNSDPWAFSPGLDTISPLGCPQFTVVKKGDVNGNFNPNGLVSIDDRHAECLPLLVQNRFLSPGQHYSIPIRIGSPAGLLGLQMALQFDAAALEILNVQAANLPHFDQDSWYAQDGRLTISWFTENEVALSAGAVLLNLQVCAIQPGDWAISLFPEAGHLRSEVYLSTPTTQTLEWRVEHTQVNPIVVSPNPARDYFVVSLESKYSKRTSLQLLDLHGRVVFEQRLLLEAGKNSPVIRPGALPDGVYFVRIGDYLLEKLIWSAY